MRHAAGRCERRGGFRLTQFYRATGSSAAVRSPSSVSSKSLYFNNDPHACALRDARRFALAAEHAGLQPTRVPVPHDVAVS